MALFDNLNPQQLQLLMSLMRGGGGQQPAPMPIPGAAPGLSPQQALMQQQINPPPNPMQQIMQQLGMIQQMQQMQAGQGGQGTPNNALLSRLPPQLQTFAQLLTGGSRPPMTSMGSG